MRFERSGALPGDVEAVVIGVPSDRLDAVGAPASLLEAQGFEGRPDQTATVVREDGTTQVYVGVGPSAQLDVLALRRAAAVAARACGRRRSAAYTLLDLVPSEDQAAATEAIVEGILLAGYRFSRYRSEPPPPSLERVVLAGAPSVADDDGEAAIERARRVAEAVALARDLVNTPGGELTPALFAEAAVEVAERENLRVTVLGPDEIAEAGLGGLLGVNRGSLNPPRFVELSYEPDDPEGSLALVGKGITFDSGGLSIKTAEGMMTMKDDMGGAAAVLGAFSALAAVRPRCRVSGYLPLTDNMSGGDATRPGDVLKIRNGKTVEVLNTDAEGRLILADALSLASEARPDAIVDLATLTGAVEVALGNRIAGLLGNDQHWIDEVRSAAERVGERVWQLPMPDDYRPRLDSDVADLRNISKTKDAGTITAALFLREFVGEGIPWAHLDIAGVAWWGDADEAEMSRGGTGWGVRTLLELARTFRAGR
ncbi:MAG: leucyl aminopeptidase [Acidimicrobiales bacterium]